MTPTSMLLLGWLLQAAPAADAGLPPDETAEVKAQLDLVAKHHGAPGPWAVEGYRMARHAARLLGVKSIAELDVEHRSPAKSQFTCIADGVRAAFDEQAVNIKWVESSAAETQTTFLHRSTGRRLVLRPSQAFVKQFLDAPREQARVNGRRVLLSADAELFTAGKD